MHLAVALVLLRHLEEIAQPALENVLSISRHVEPADPDALIPFREALEVLPRLRIALQGGDDVRRETELLAHPAANLFHPGRCHQSRADHSSHPFLVRFRKLALRAPARTE